MSYVGKIVDTDGSTGLIGSTLYGTCATAADTVAKVGTLTDFDTLIDGVTVHIKFTYSNTATDPTLNINGTGAKRIYKNGTTSVGKTVATSWAAGSVVSLTYDGSAWQMNDHTDDTNTTYSAGTGLTLSSTTFNHSNSITAGTAKGDDSKTLTFGGTFAIPTVTYDAQGHITGKGTTTMTMPSNPNTDTKVTSTANHYTPATVSGQDKTASATGATAAWSIDVVKGVTLNTDGKGHVTGLSVTSGKIPSNPNTDTKVNVTLATTTKAYLLGTSTTPTATAQAVTSVADTGVYLDTTAGTLCGTSLQASSTVCANTAGNSASGGLSLYSTNPDSYGVIFRGTSQKGKHGYVQDDWATYFTMTENTASSTWRGWIFRDNTNGSIASIDGRGHAVFNGSVTVGGNTTNTSGCRMEYNSSTQSLDFVFV